MNTETISNLLEQLKLAGEFANKNLIEQLINYSENPKDIILSELEKLEPKTEKETWYFLHLARLLGHWKVKEAIPIIINAWEKETCIIIAEKLAYVLAQIGPDSIMPVKEYLKKENIIGERFAIASIAAQYDEIALQTLLEYLEQFDGSDMIIAEILAYGIMSFNRSEGKKAIQNILHNPDIKNETKTLLKHIMKTFASRNTNVIHKENYENRNILDLYYDEMQLTEALYQKHQKEGAHIFYRGDEPYKRESKKIGRNDPCPCGSGKKYKKCCGRLK